MKEKCLAARDQGRDCDQHQVRADHAEGAIGDYLRRMTQPEDWQAEALALIHREAGRGQEIVSDRKRIKGQLERLKRLFVLGDLAEGDYTLERDRLEAQLAALIPPDLPDPTQAASLLRNIDSIRDAAKPKERREIVQTLAEAVYLDAEEGPVVAIEPKAEYRALFEMAGITKPPIPKGDSAATMSHTGATGIPGPVTLRWKCLPSKGRPATPSSANV
jgi:hypothetical protein